MNRPVGRARHGALLLSKVRRDADIAQIAIKTMKKTFESFSPCLELREVVFLRTLPHHQHLVPALDIFLDPFTKKLHICMEYMEGNLYQLMKARDHKPLDNSSVKSILFQIMQGLEHIHAHSFFHRDIKPENILVSTSSHQDTTNSFRRYSSLVTPPSTPPTYTVKIADFGLARETHSKLPYTTYVSTRWYRAPEVLLRAGEYSAPVDIWAIGAMAVEVATLKPLFPGGNEVDQVWRVCEIMGSPGNWYNKAGQRVGGGDWREGTRLAGKLGFSFPKMAPHSMDTILQTPQWPAALSQFVTWCLMWDPKNRPTSTQALAHEYFSDAVDPLRPKSSASKMLGRKPSQLRSTSKDATTPTISSKPSWFRKSLIGRTESSADLAAAQAMARDAPAAKPQQPVPVALEVAPIVPAKSRPAANKRTTWTNGISNVAPMPILPTIRPISPLSDTVTAQANSRTPSYNDAYANAHRQGHQEEKSKKLGRQLSVQSNTNHYAEIHRQNAERALNGHGGLSSPPSAHKEGFFSHLRKRARRFSGRHQTPVSPIEPDMETQAGCGPWGGNSARSSMVMAIDSPPAPVSKDTYESLDRALRDDQPNSDNLLHVPGPPAHQASSTANLKRHHSLPQHQVRSADHSTGTARTTGPISSRTRRAQAAHGVRQYDAPDEEDELLDEVLTSTQKATGQFDKHSSAVSTTNSRNPYPTPSPSANGQPMMYEGQDAVQPKPLDLNRKAAAYKWPTPPYEPESEWGASASASIWAASNRF
ncbi:unnamed protein product [Discula destructiva]